MNFISAHQKSPSMMNKVHILILVTRFVFFICCIEKIQQNSN